MKAEVIWGDQVLTHSSYAEDVKKRLYYEEGFTAVKLEIAGEHAGHNIYKLVAPCSEFGAAITFFKTALNHLEMAYGVRVRATLQLDGCDLSQILRELIV